uniref:Uncharacterized protein n=1 Tax=Spongospora subterranea TaxID=70186 RepID=A0A0H5RCZ0_9EUKA|eukprot:CRZ11467.1 hypothetical protein [Spongospora subterranea]
MRGLDSCLVEQHNIQGLGPVPDQNATADEVAAFAERLHSSFGCLESTIELYDRAIALRPSSGEFHLSRAFLNMYSRNDSAALVDSANALTLNPSLMLASYIRATVLFDMSRKTQTASGRSYHSENDVALRRESVDVFQNVELQYRSLFGFPVPSGVDPRLLLGRLYALRRIGSPQEAREFLESLLHAWEAPSMQVWVDVAAINTYQELGMTESAGQHLMYCMHRVACHPLALSWIVYNQALKIDPLCALSLYQRAFRLFFNVQHSPRCQHAVDYVNRISGCHDKLGAKERALKVLTVGLEQYPNSPSLLHARGLIYSDAGKTDEALSDMWAAKGADPKNLSRYNSIMAVLGDARRFEAMWVVADHVIQLHGGIQACADMCFLSMVVISGTVQEMYGHARQASDRMLTLQRFLAQGDMEFVSMHRVRLFAGMWGFMQRKRRANEWLTQTTILMKQRRIVDLYGYLCRAVHGISAESIDWPVSSDGCTALFWAASECTDRPELADSLITFAGADVDFRNCSGRTALAYAIQNNHPRIAQALVADGASIHSRDCFGNTALSYLGEKGDLKVMERALYEGGLQYQAKREAVMADVSAIVMAGPYRGLDANSFSIISSFWDPSPKEVMLYMRHIIHRSQRCSRT